MPCKSSALLAVFGGIVCTKSSSQQPKPKLRTSNDVVVLELFHPGNGGAHSCLHNALGAKVKGGNDSVQVR